ncbi:ASKHA domain-containing protein [Oceanirhabdus sp. W0125-5]|uniref:ASKHA domain-containing protein n=1 Tax=Oceanirhabdus sp. W0125-5 TaxID=2999116 RepID=UPI0022F2D80C|nr:ASKHA domain-containing protein [Oceanirhabdus sp. W0125-5]WBW95909.1 ASKHA domain-containing protein [Oceanirhabdus sp. W0125-5]
MSYLTVASRDKKIGFKEGETLLNILQDNGVFVENPCGGKGTCGKCKVRIIEGVINEPTEEEVKFLTKDELVEEIRLSCLVRPTGDLTVELLNNKNVKHKILADGYMPEFEINPVIYKKVHKLTKPSLENNLSYEELLEDALHVPVYKDNLSLLRSLPEIFEHEEVTAVYSGEEFIGVESGDTSRELYGIAVDIGTTTVVASLVDLNSGKEISSESEINPQKEYGLDVLSRIDFTKTKENGLNILQKLIIDCLNSLTSELCIKNKIDINSVYEMTIAANATMMHLLLGVNTNSIGKSPYATVFSREKNLLASSIGINLSPFARVYCLPGVSSYIGADIVAGAVVSELDKTDKNLLFIDIGTNGEIVLSKRGELSSCSCAAGPALEGMNISCGMRAAEGAVEGVKFNEDGISLKVIGDKAPIGICGSGILDAISEIARVKLIGKTGRLKKKSDIEENEELQYLSKCLIEVDRKRKIYITSGEKEITITQGDIRQVQLAKGAILSGFYALLDLLELDMMDLDEVIIAGQFGKHLSVDSLVGSGIIPGELSEKIRYIGNSSKTGALMCLMSKEAREDMEKVAKKIHYFELSTKEGYDKLFTKCLNFN